MTTQPPRWTDTRHAPQRTPGRPRTVDDLPEYAREMLRDVLDIASRDPWSFPAFNKRDPEGEDVRSARVGQLAAVYWINLTVPNFYGLLPQQRALGYNIGYNGGRPHALAAYLSQVAATNGEETAAGVPYEQAQPAILAWTQSSAADRGTSELTVHDLRAMQRG
ncbi:hypothetical protein [Streptomyces sp. 8N706]|uniref:hypothetical protein n=1 Tax=Streptomyces sp. 8N706 TaxID=3457416 RepID=UPI003FD685E1